MAHQLSTTLDNLTSIVDGPVHLRKEYYTDQITEIDEQIARKEVEIEKYELAQDSVRGGRVASLRLERPGKLHVDPARLHAEELAKAQGEKMRAYTERYRSTDVGTVNRVRLVIMMYEGAIAAIRAARKHLEGGEPLAQGDLRQPGRKHRRRAPERPRHGKGRRDLQKPRSALRVRDRAVDGSQYREQSRQARRRGTGPLDLEKRAGTGSPICPKSRRPGCRLSARVPPLLSLRPSRKPDARCRPRCCSTWRTLSDRLGRPG